MAWPHRNIGGSLEESLKENLAGNTVMAATGLATTVRKLAWPA
jgi:hypothetical protein